RGSQCLASASRPPTRSQPLRLSAAAVKTFGSRTSCKYGFRRMGRGSSGTGGAFDEGPQVVEGPAGRVVRVVDEGVQLDRHPAVVAGPVDRVEDLGEVDRPGAGHEVMMLAGRRDVL